MHPVTQACMRTIIHGETNWRNKQEKGSNPALEKSPEEVSTGGKCRGLGPLERE